MVGLDLEAVRGRLHRGMRIMLLHDVVQCTDGAGGYDARWSMAAIDDSIGGFGHFERSSSNRPIGCINRDPSRRGDRVDGGQ